MHELKPLVLTPPLNVTLITDNKGLVKLADFFTRQKVLGWDKETEPKKDFYWRKQRLEQFGDRNEQYVVDLLGLAGGDADLLCRVQGNYGKNVTAEFKEFLSIIEPVVCSDEWLKCGVQLGFEYLTAYWGWGLRTYNFYDCALAEKCIYAGLHSLKDFGFYSMEDMCARYFGVSIDKSLQESFTIDGVLTPQQIEYAALDTRMPLALRDCQQQVITGQTVKSRQSKGLSTAVLSRVPVICTGDNLEEIVKIQNDAIGSFEDMHIHGETIDRDKWRRRLEKKKRRKIEVLAELDKVFVPIVGEKGTIPTEEELTKATEVVESLKIVSGFELELKTNSRKSELSKQQYTDYKNQKLQLLSDAKEIQKDLKHRRTQKFMDEVAGCEGQAKLNYKSSTQLLDALHHIKGVEKINSTGDEVLEELSSIPVVKLLQEFRSLDKEIGTYGEAWFTEWVTKPCKAEGWLHPGDGRIHHVYNIYAAETNRSSSEKPNGQNLPYDPELRSCYTVDPPDAEEPDGYVYITADMSGAELRIIADDSGDPIWIGAFNRGEDLHSVGTELLFPDEWPTLALSNCAYFKLKEDGTPQRKKCKCPGHMDLRDKTKSVNFLLAYGGGPTKLAKAIKKTFEFAKRLMNKHRMVFPGIWEYLEKSGQLSRIMKRSIDMFGCRRLFPDPTWDLAKEKARDDREEKLEYSEDVQKKNIDMFIAGVGRKPTSDEKWTLTHREPTSKEIGNALQAMSYSIERQGKNHKAQGTNASGAKIAMAILWHKLPKYNAKLKKFVHDELVIQCPKRHGEAVARLIGEAFKEAFARKMKHVEMTFEYNIAPFWKK